MLSDRNQAQKLFLIIIYMFLYGMQVQSERNQKHADNLCILAPSTSSNKLSQHDCQICLHDTFIVMCFKSDEISSARKTNHSFLIRNLTLLIIKLVQITSELYVAQLFLEFFYWILFLNDRYHKSMEMYRASAWIKIAKITPAWGEKIYKPYAPSLSDAEYTA